MSNSILKYFKPKPSPKVEKKEPAAKVAELGGSGDDGVEVATVAADDDDVGVTSFKRDDVKKRPLAAIENNLAIEEVATSTPGRTGGGASNSQAAKRRRILKSFADDDDESDNEADNSAVQDNTVGSSATPKPAAAAGNATRGDRTLASALADNGEGEGEINDRSWLETSLNASYSSAVANTSVLASADDLSTPCFPHLSYEFLQEGKIRDFNGNRKGDANYDPTTLKVPTSFLNQQSPAMRQWWELKSKNFATILFFKMGKFYEFFHMDAVTAVSECGLRYMSDCLEKGKPAHAGVPEAAFEMRANFLVEKGYKLARIEQTETPKMMEARCKGMARPTKFDKVVERKICQRLSIGTRTFNESGADEEHLIAIHEVKGAGDSARPVIGACVCNPGLSKLFFGQFEDDALYSRTLSLLSFITVSEMLLHKSALSPELQKLLGNFPAVRKTETKFPGAQHAVEAFVESGYYPEAEAWPVGLKGALESDLRTPLASSTMAWAALGAVVNILKDAMVDHDVLALGDINDLSDLSSVMSDSGNRSSSGCIGKSMILFGDTTRNLDLLPSQVSQSGGGGFDLFSALNHASTPFGKRLLRQWVCNPLLRREDIVGRQDAVRDLERNAELVKETKKTLKRLCDFEKLTSALFAAGQKQDSHPDSEAIIFEKEKQLKRHINYLVACLKGFEDAHSALGEFADRAEDFESPHFKKFCSSDLSCLEELRRVTEEFRGAFDYSDALDKNRIVPKGRGVDADYDVVKDRIGELDADDKKYLKEQKTLFGSNDVKYWGTGKNAYQLEVPERAAKRAGSEHTLSSERKGYKRYTTPKTEELKERKAELEDEERAVCEKIHANMFNRFCSHRHLWRRVVNLLAGLDCLISLHDYSCNGIIGDSCFPEILENNKEGEEVVEIRNGKHPLLLSGDFIPNDVVLSQKVFILTGANMGGKSTVMRQTALLVILAQMGCKVPAESMRLSPVDRVFSRMGANDNIMEGKSTFFVEMAETSNILEHVTPSSLVVIDELGRGTTTHDGSAIAAAVVDFLAEKKCRTLFSTHYHELTEQFGDDDRVSLYHMRILDPTETQPLTFLYKLDRGRCSKSHGFHAAKVAGVSDDVIELARRMAGDMEERQKAFVEFRRAFRV